MFQIFDINENLIGITDEVIYIKINPTTNVFISASKEDACGVAYRGIAYNLFGHSDIENTKTVIVKEVDGGSKLYDLVIEKDELSSQLQETDEAAIELYEANLALEQILIEQDEAIIEIYEKMEAIK